MSLAGPWVGRSDELARVTSTLTRDSGLRGTVIAGPAGVGKTRLAAEGAARVARLNWAVQSFVASASARRLPLGAFAGLRVSAGSADPFQAVNAVLESLLSSGGSRTVIAVDDVHQLDETSALVVHQLVHRTHARVLLTLRTGEPVPEAIAALWKDALLERVDLEPLSEAEVAELVQAVLGGPVEPHASRKLWTLTRGNVLYARRIIDDERRAGRLTVTGGAWTWLGDHVVSPTLVELITAQMGAIPPAVADVVDLLAIAEPLPFAAVRHTLGGAAIESAELAGLVVATPSERPDVLRLAHPLFGEVRRVGIGPVRAARLRGVAAGMLATQAPTTRLGVDAALRRAVLTMDSDLPGDADLFLAGAREASRLLQLPLAERLARASATVGGGADAVIVGALAVSLMSRGEDARDLLAAVPWDGPDPYVVALGTLRAGNLFFDLADTAQARAVLAEAQAHVADPATERGLGGIDSVMLAFGGSPQQALAIGDSQGWVDAPALARLMLAWGRLVAHGDRGDLVAMRDDLAGALSLAESDPGVAMLRYPIVMTYESALLNLGEVAEARQVTADVVATLTDLPGGARSMAFVIVGLVDLGQGRVAEAAERLQAAVAAFEMSGDTAGWLQTSLIAYVRAAAQLGDVVRTDRSYELMAAREHAAFVRYEPEKQLAGAWVDAVRGATSRARLRAQEAAETARGRGQRALEMLALHTAVRFDDRTCAERLAQLATAVQGSRAELAAEHAQALALGDAGRLLAVALRLEAAQDVLPAADAAAQASAQFRAAGRVGSALSAAATARRLAGGATSPALSLIDAPSLSERERECALLAARGLSNRAIADLLVVSVRTVEGHIYRASTKVGASSRSDLARLLGAGPG